MDAAFRHEDEPFLDREVCFGLAEMERMVKWCLEMGGQIGDAGYRVELDRTSGAMFLRVRAYRRVGAPITGSHLDVYGGC